VAGIGEAGADGLGNACGVEVFAGGGEVWVQGGDVGGVVMGTDMQDDLLLVSGYLHVCGLGDTTLLTRHDAAGRVGGVDLGRFPRRFRGSPSGAHPQAIGDNGAR
jgi:hypothetical protein